MTINSPIFFMRLTPQLITKGRSVVCEHHHRHDLGDDALQRVRLGDWTGRRFHWDCPRSMDDLATFTY